TNFGADHVPLCTDLAELVHVFWGNNRAHALLRLRRQNFRCGHVLCTQWNIVQVDYHAAIASCCQLRRSTGEAVATQVPKPYDHTSCVELQAALNEDLFCKRVADLYGWELALFAFFEGGRAQHGHATDAVNAGARTKEHYLVAGTGSKG